MVHPRPGKRCEIPQACWPRHLGLDSVEPGADTIYVSWVINSKLTIPGGIGDPRRQSLVRIQRPESGMTFGDARQLIWQAI
jgi:hypothetical protein